MALYSARKHQGGIHLAVSRAPGFQMTTDGVQMQQLGPAGELGTSPKLFIPFFDHLPLCWWTQYVLSKGYFLTRYSAYNTPCDTI